MKVAIITGGSRGLGEALARALAERQWVLVLDARGAEPLEAVARQLRTSTGTEVRAVAGDIADPQHRQALVDAALELAGDAGIAAVVNNASVLGPSPQPELADYPLDVLRHVYEVNVVA